MPGIRILLLISLLGIPTSFAVKNVDFVAPFEEAFGSCEWGKPEKKSVSFGRVELRRAMCGKIGLELDQEYEAKTLSRVRTSLYALEGDDTVAKAVSVATATATGRGCQLEKKESTTLSTSSTYRCNGYRLDIRAAKRDSSKISDVTVTARIGK